MAFYSVAAKPPVRSREVVALIGAFGCGIIQCASERLGSFGCGATVLEICVAGKSQFCSPFCVRWFGELSSWRTLFPVGQFISVIGCILFGGIVVHWRKLHSISIANNSQQGDGFYVTASPSLQNRACG